jgi:hypothetical protein
MQYEEIHTAFFASNRRLDCENREINHAVIVFPGGECYTIDVATRYLTGVK